MKNVFSILFMMLSIVLFARENTVSSDIKSVVVFLKSARITRNATVNLKKGENKVVLGKLSDQVIENSLLVKVLGNAALLSASYQLNYLELDNRDELIASYEDSISSLGNKISILSYKRDVYSNEKATLLKNDDLKGTNTGFEVEELKRLLDYQRERAMELNELLYGLDQKIMVLEEKEVSYKSQIKMLSGNSKRPDGEIILNVYANGPQKVSIEADYLIKDAGWTPVYDLRVDDIKKPADLIYKALVHQNSGVNWDQVKMTISNGAPLLNQNFPVLNKLKVSVYDNHRYKSKKRGYQRARIQTHSYGGGGGRGSLKRDRKSEREENRTVVYKVVEKQNQITTEYEINLPQTIKADNQEYLVNIKSYNLPADFHYYAAPKLSKHAYLLAEIREWGEYNLLAANANIFFEGAYVGKTYLDPNTSNDTLAVSMGIDKNVQVSRDLVKDKTGSRLLGLKRKLDYYYEFKVLNNKKTEIEIEIVDQIPVASQKEVEVTLETKSEGKLDRDSGEVSWEFTLPSGESKKWSFHYSIKYPKGKRIRGTK